MDTLSAQRRDAASDAASDAALDRSAPLQLVRAAATLRWKRPDLTVTLAELALDAADDAATWVAAAGWLLHGRTLLGDGRQIACDLLDGLGRWGGAGAELMAGPHGRRLRVELAAPARRTGEPAAARALLAADPGVDALDAELRADVLTELARCAADETPDTADAALDVAEQAWSAASCEPGVASVLLVRAARDRRAGRVDAAVDAAVAGLARVNASGRRAGGTDCDHLAAALTAEWIAALVDAGRLDEARGDALSAADRLLGSTRPSRQLVALRLAVARVAAVNEGAGAVLAALEPAAQDAVDGDVPELESACRSMLGELHEAAGRLDAALGAVRAAMAAERRDHDRGARLRTRLAAVTASWAARPSGPHDARYPAPSTSADAEPAPNGTAGRSEAGRSDMGPIDVDRAPSAFDVVGSTTTADELGSGGRPSDPERDASPPQVHRAARARTRAEKWSGAVGPGRRVRRLAAEAAAESGWSDAALPELGTSAAERSHRDPGSDTPAPPATSTEKTWFDDPTAALHPDAVNGSAGHRALGAARRRGRAPADAPAPAGPPRPPAPTTDTGRSVAVASASLIGDALLRELVDDADPGRPHSPAAEQHRPSAAGHDGPSDIDDTVVFELDPHRDSTVAVPPVRSTRRTDQSEPDRRDPEPEPVRADAPSVGSDTVRVASPAEREHAGTARRPHGQHDPAAPAADPRAPNPSRRRPADTDGLGIGDLLAGALAAYRGI